MRIGFTIIFLAVLSLSGGRSAVQAQSYGASSPYGGSPSYSSMSGRMGIFGSRSLGSNLTAGQRSFGGSSFDANDSLGNQGLGSGRPLGANRQPGDFVGADMQGMQHFVGAAQAASGAGGWSQPGWLSSPMGGAGQNYFPRWQNADQNRQQEPTTSERNSNAIRTTLRVAFDCPQPAPDRISTSLARRLAELPANQNRSPIQVQVRGRTAILRGEVSTEHDRAIMEQVVRLEPGIEAVKNEIVVAGPKPAEAETP